MSFSSILFPSETSLSKKIFFLRNHFFVLDKSSKDRYFQFKFTQNMFHLFHILYIISKKNLFCNHPTLINNAKSFSLGYYSSYIVKDILWKKVAYTDNEYFIFFSPSHSFFLIARSRTFFFKWSCNFHLKQRLESHLIFLLLEPLLAISF